MSLMNRDCNASFVSLSPEMHMASLLSAPLESRTLKRTY